MDARNDNENAESRLGCLAYAMGGASFIPLLGVPLGIVSIVYGLLNSKRGGGKLALLGAGGILFTTILYGTLFYKGFVEKGGTFENLKGKLAQTELTTLVREIEYYKIEHGIYPTDLKVLMKKEGDNQVMIYEPYSVWGGKDAQPFVYQVYNGGANYHLFSRGPDGIAGTADDISPAISESEQGKIGYRRNAQ